MIRPRRKQHIHTFSIPDNFTSIILLGILFIAGFVIIWTHNRPATAVYLVLWAVSYIIIYAGTCRYCAYYGKNCPIPLEGSCVHYFFEKKDKPFGFLQLFWATVAYGFRVILPVIFIFRYQMIGWGTVYFSVLALFWIIHLRFSGCPNCINVQCPLNPEHRNLS